MNPGLRSGELAEAAGVNPQTLRYYERRGLLAEPARSPGGHRLYPAEALTLLQVIKTAQRLGFTLDEVAELVDLGTHRHGRRRDTSLGLACALCCAIPLLLAAGILGGAGWAALGQVMPGIALALAALTALAWWSTRRRTAHAAGCPGDACSCSQPS